MRVGPHLRSLSNSVRTNGNDLSNHHNQRNGKDTMMPAYSVTLCNVDNFEKFMEYAKHSGPIVAKYGGRFLARGGELAVMEGHFDYGRLIIIEFPDMETAK